MLNDRVRLFIGRREAIELFKLLYKYDWRQKQLLPILLLLAPPGGGVSLLLNVLARKCETSISYASLDGAEILQSSTLSDLLSDISTQLIQASNGNSPKLHFPRYHLGISAISDNLSDNNQDKLASEIKKLVFQSSRAEKFEDILAASNQLPPLSFLLVLFKWMLPNFLSLLPKSTVGWYEARKRALNVSMTSSGVDVLIRLRNWSRPGSLHEHRIAVENLLFDAFLEDLREDFNVRKFGNAKDHTTYVVLLFKHFDKLPGDLGRRFLSLLIESRSREQGQFDPLLVVIGSQTRLFDDSNKDQHPPFLQEDEQTAVQIIEKKVKELYEQWKNELARPAPSRVPPLYIPIWLQDFDVNASINILRMMDYEQTGLFEDVALAKALHHVTHGHPLALTLAARAFVDAKTNGINPSPYTLLDAPLLSSQQGHRYASLREQLLDVLLKGLSDEEKKQLVFCIAPRQLTPDTFRVALDIIDEREAKRRWSELSVRTFTCITNIANRSLEFHPLLRSLLMQRLVSLSEEKRNYYKVVHSNLREHFAELALSGNEEAKREEGYHALALGDPTLAINIVRSSLINKDTVWEKMIEIVEQAPITSMPRNTQRQMQEALERVRSNSQEAPNRIYSSFQEDIATALVLYTWLAQIPYVDNVKYSNVLFELAAAYRYLGLRNMPSCFERSERYFDKARNLAVISNEAGSSSAQLVPDLQPFQKRKIDKTWRRIQTAMTLLLLIALIVSYPTMYVNTYYPSFCDPVAITEPITVMTSLAFSHGISVTRTQDGQCIGLSDGAFAFDTTTNQESGHYKKQASEALRAGDRDEADILWEKAKHIDTSDAETLIYQENQHVMNKVKEQRIQYVTIVVLTMLTANEQDQKSIATGRDDLQGAYIAQVEHNKDFRVPLIRIVIANSGGNTAYAPEVTKQIIEATHADHTIVGVMGPAQSRDKSVEAIKMLGQAHIPIISSTASSDALTKISPYFFRASPPNKYQVQVAIRYAENVLNVKKAVLFEALNDNYSQSLAADFIEQFQKNDHNTILQTETYDYQDVDVSNTIHDKAGHACSFNPDMIYFTGRSDAMIRLLDSLNPCGANTVKIMGGDTLDLLASAPNSGYPPYAYNRLYYTSFAFPEEWELAGLGQYRPSFFDNYPRYFDPRQEHAGKSVYGYTQANGHVILAYDATFTLQQAIMDAVKNTKRIDLSPEDVRTALAHINGANAVQGAGGCISLGPNGDPMNKVIVMLRIDGHGDTKLVQNGVLGKLKKMSTC